MKTLHDVHAMVITKSNDRASHTTEGMTFKTVLAAETTTRRLALVSSKMVFESPIAQHVLDTATIDCKQIISDMGFFDIGKDRVIGAHAGAVMGIYVALMSAWFADSEDEFNAILSESNWWHGLANGTYAVVTPHVRKLLSSSNYTHSVSALDIVRNKLNNARRTFSVYKDVSGDAIVEYGYPNICSACASFHSKDVANAYEFIAHLFQEFKSKEEDKWTIPVAVGGVDMVNDIVAMLEDHQSFEKLS